MNCEACREAMMAYLKNQLDDTDHNAVAVHLDQCVACRKELEGVRKVLEIVDAADQPSIRELVDEIIEGAYRARASDIHFQPLTDTAAVRYRVDGVLRDERELTKEQHAATVARVKYMANMDQLEQRMPQDGRVVTVVNDVELDLRVSCLPAAAGESVVVRLMSPRDAALSLAAIGLSEANGAALDRLLHSPCGTVIVSGPTGSGKSTTLYAILCELNRRERSVSSIEDPVEYRIDGVNQIAVDRRAGLSFSVAMRHLLRQDPDVIMCAEIRDRETLEAVTSAALTGHLMLSTLHTNDAPSVLRRLCDIGLDRFLISETLLGVLAQRLVRCLCTECRQLRPISVEEREWLLSADIEQIPDEVWGRVGCDECRQTGYRGRAAVHEVLVIDDELRQLLADGTDLEHIERLAGHKMRRMAHDAAEKVLEGRTDVVEARRVVRYSQLRQR